MDPNAVLARLRALFRGLDDGSSYDDALATIEEAQQSFEALDGWLSKGGFLPEAWRNKTNPYE
jgi:hypothetical protein